MTTNPIAEAFIEFRPDTSSFLSQSLSSITKSVNVISDEVKSIMSKSGIESGKAFADSASESVQKNLDFDRGGAISRQVREIGNMIKFGIGFEVVNAFASLPSAAVGVAASFEQTRIAFEGILGSAQTANSFLSELQKFAATTPFEFPELAKVSQQLLAVGYSSKEVIPILTDIGNAAAALGVSGEGISLVVRALGQMKGKGKISAEELNQISENMPGFSAIAAIAASRGESVAQAFDSVSKGAVSAAEGIPAIVKGMKNFQGAAGAMERQSKTLNGVISTFKDNLKLIAIDFITPKLPQMAASVNKVSDLISHLFK